MLGKARLAILHVCERTVMCLLIESLCWFWVKIWSKHYKTSKQASEWQ
jgi:hypothetical protein